MVPFKNLQEIALILDNVNLSRVELERALVLCADQDIPMLAALFCTSSVIGNYDNAGVLEAYHMAKDIIENKINTPMEKHIALSRLARALETTPNRTEIAHSVAHTAEAAVANTASSASGHAARSMEAAFRVNPELKVLAIDHLKNLVSERAQIQEGFINE